MRKFKKFIALLMTVMMFISMLPMDALAEIIAGGGNASEGKQIPIAVLSVTTPPTVTRTYVFVNGKNDNGEDNVFASQILKNGEELVNPGTPSYPAAGQAANKEFTGWYIGEEKITFPYTASVGTTSDTVTVEARFDDVYFVFFTNPNGDVMVTKKGKVGEEISTEGVTYPVGNEQSIIGWNYTGNEDDPLISKVKLEGGDVTLKAVVKDGHWITYDSQGGTYVAPAFVKGGATTTAPAAAPTRPGYTFQRWSATVGGAAFDFGQQLDQALTLHAVWTPNDNTRYTVIHWLENADDNEYSYKESETKTGATGAQTNAAAKSYTGFTAQTIAQQTIAGDGSTIVNVYYKRNEYEVKFYEYKSGFFGIGGSWEENTSLRITAKHGANIRAKWPTGTFWYVSQNNQNTAQSNLDTMPIGGKNFYGKASGNGKAYYYVEVLPGESGTETVGGKTYKLDHTDTGYTNGSVTDEERYEMTGFTCNVQYSAKNESSYSGSKFYYDRNSYNVVYINSGSQAKATPYLYQQSIADAGNYELTDADAPAGKEGYVFAGWYDAPEGGNEFIFTGKTMPAQNVTVYAHWAEPTVIGKAYITIDGTGNVTTFENVTYGGTITDQLNALQETIMKDKTGYTWRGWRTGPNGTGEPFNVDTKIYSDITLYPYYTKDGTFTVKYVSGKNDVTAPEDGKSYAEDSFADLKSPGKLVAADGEYFLGWSDGAATYQPRDKYQIKSNHANEQNVITLTAQWGPRPAGTTLTYKANGGAGEDVVENLANNATVTTRPGTTFSRVGYTFKGWDTDPKGEGSIAPNTQVQVDNKDGANVLYAIWTANTDTKYTVEFYYQNVNGTYTLDHSDKRTATTDTEVSVTDADKAAKENNKYVYDESAANVDSGIVAGDGSLVLKLYFKLNTASYTIHHYLLGTTTEVAKDETGTKNIGDELTANMSPEIYEKFKGKVSVSGYSPSQTITVSATGNEIIVYYKTNATLVVNNGSWIYDGTEHGIVVGEPAGNTEAFVYVSDYGTDGESHIDNGNYTYTYVFTNEKGETITTGTAPAVTDANEGNPLTVKVIAEGNGNKLEGELTLTVKKRKVTLTSEGGSKPYDGTPLTKPDVTVTGDGFVAGEVTDIKATGSVTFVHEGEVTNAITYTKGENFKSGNYNISKTEGKLSITAKAAKITITAASDSKTYDGTALTNNGYTWTEGVLAEGDVLTAVVEGSATNVGDEGKNVVKSYKVMRGDVDVTKNYTFGNSVDGKLTINPRTVTLTSETASKEYDGTPLTKPDVTVTGDGFVDGEVTDVKATGSVTFVHEGEVTNAITYTEGANFKGTNYTISKEEGKLSITKREGEGKTITVTANSDEKVYDGAPLTNNGFTHAGALVEGDTLTAVVEGSQTDVGSSDNVVTSYKVMRGETDVTTSYTFADSVKGALTVTARAVTFTGESKSLPYTGGMQSITGITQSGLVEGHEYEGLTYKAEGQNVGSYDGAFSGNVVIKDAQGNNVTKNYNVTKTPGKLTITNASFAVTFTGESDTKVYNGSEQSITGITVEGLKPGHKYVKEDLTYVAKGTDAGEYVGAFTGTVKILDENNVDVTENYAITQNPGTLTITAYTAEVVVTISGGTATKTYDGKEHIVKGYEIDSIQIDGKDSTLYTVDDFKFTGTAEAKGTNAGEYKMGLKVSDFRNDSKNFANVKFIVTDGELVISKRPVKVYAKTLEYLYDYANPAAHPADDVARYTVEAANGDRGLLAGDALNADVLYDGQSTQTLIGVYQAVAQIAAAKITNANGDVTANYAIEKEDGSLTIKGNNPLDPKKETTNKKTNYTVGDVIEYKITVKNVSRDEATNVVVTDSMAEIQDSADYTVSEDRHTATIASIPAGGTVLVYARHTVTAEDVENAYAGDASGSLTNVANIKFGDWNKDVEGDHDELNDTYEYVVRYYWNNYTSVQPHEEKKLTARVGTEVTEEPAVIEGYTPVSADSRKLIISADQSKNVIEFYYYKNVELTANSETYTYDGTEKQVSGLTIKGENKDQDDQLIAADFSAITVGAKGTDAGEYPANFAENTVGTVDKTGRYIVTAANNGKLVINPVTGQLITITANSASKIYDGTPLMDNGFTFTQGVLADGDVLTAVVEGSATNVGDEGKNVVKSYVVKRGETDVTKNYTFGNSIDGKLTINPRPVTLTSETASKEYDGTPLTKPDVTVTGDGFVAGEVSDIKATGSVTFVHEGEVLNTITFTRGEKFNEKNYDITYNTGKLKVTQNEKAITVTANSHTWEYDGQPHSDGGYTVNYDGVDYKVEAGETATLPTGDVVKAKITKTVTNVSDSAVGNNTIDELTIVNAAGEDTKGQYETVTPIPGTLTITKRGAGEDKVKITAADNTVEYDGKPHGAKLNAAGQIEVGTSYTVTNLAEGHSVKTLAIEGSETDAGVYADKLVPGNAVIVDGNGVEVTANYDITYVPGALTITRRGEGDDKVVLTAADNTVVYDGQPHGAKLNAAGEIEAGTSYTITNLADGHKVQSVVISGSETAVGEYEDRLVPSGAKIVDAEGNDVTRNYVVGYKNGKLTITSPDTVIVTIKGKTDTVEYNGQKHKVDGYEVVSISNTLYTANDFGLKDGAAAHAEGTDAGDYFMNLTKDSFVNRNANFSAVTFVVEDGKLTITKRGLDEKNLVKIIAADNTVYYDGQPHGAKLNAANKIEVNVSYTTEYLAPGHKVQTVAIDGSETAVGEYKNKLVPSGAIIVDENDNDVTRNYVITYVPGTLEIRRNETEIKVTANSHTWEYDGQPHSDGGYTVNYDGVDYPVAAGEFATLPTGDKVTATVEGSVTNVADSADDNNVVTNVTITNEAGTVVNDQYKTIETVNGGLKITWRGDSEDEDKKVKIIAEPNTVEYDGNAHGAKLNAAGQIEVGTSYTTVRLVEGHNVDETTLDITGSQTNVGVYEEELKPAVKAGATRIVIRDKDGNDVTANYALTLVPATLTITGDKLIPDKKAEDENIESNYKLGDKIEFTITVKNVSIYDVENVIVTDANAEIQAGDGYTVSADKHTATIAIIAAKSEIRIKALHTVTSEDILAGKVGNVANVTWKDGETTVTKTVDDDTTKLTPPDVTLNVTKTSDWEGKATGAKLELGTKITYTITVKNTGNVPYTNVTFDDELEGVKVAISPIETLAVGETKTVTTKVTHTVTEADLLRGSITNKVTAKANEITYTYYEGNTATSGKATPKSNEAQVTDKTTKATVSTSSTKTTTSTPKNGERYALGETITYDIEVTNDGNLTVTDIEVVDNLEGAEIKAGNGYDVVNGKAVIAELKPGESVTVKAKYEVKEKDILAGKVLNSATVTGKGPGPDPEPDNPTKEDPTDKPKATLNIVKTVENKHEDGTPYGVGEKIAYKLTVSVGADNNVTVEDIEVTDTLLTAKNVEDGIVEIKGNYKLEDRAIKLPNMAPNADPVVIEYTYTVQESDLGENGQYGSVHNAATARGTTPEMPDNPNKPVDPTGGDEENTPTKIKLTITAGSASKEYDGEPLTKDSYTSGQLAEGHKIDSVTITGSITEVGSTDNVASGAVIKTGEKDVTSHYEITYENGTLTVSPNKTDATLYVQPYNGEYDADAHSVSGENVTGAVAGTVWTYQYRTSENAEWSDTKPMFTDVTEATVYVKASNANYEDLFTSATVTITPKAIEVKAEDERMYNGADQTLEITAAGQQTGKTVVSGETLTLNGAKITGKNAGEYVVLDGGNDNYTWSVKKADGTTDSTGNYRIRVTGKLTIKKASLSVEVAGGDGVTVYNGTEQVFPKIQDILTVRDGKPVNPPDATADNSYIVVSGLQGEDRLIPSTLHYRLVGTHANYDVTGTTMLTGEGKIYGKFFNGNDDSETAYVNGGTNKPTVVNGSPSNPTDVSENYIFTYVAGELKIKQRPVTIVGNSTTLPYNGKEQSVTGRTVSTKDGSLGLAANDTIAENFTHEAKGTNVGEYVGQFSHAEANVPFAAGSVCNGKDYAITLVKGKLTIIKNATKITISSYNQDWTYDGKEHVYDEEHTQDPAYTIEYGEKVISVKANNGRYIGTLPTGDTITITPTGKVTNVADTVAGNNTFTYVISNANQYADGSVTTNNGTLTIKPCPLTITVNDSKKYDGTPLETVYNNSDAVTTDKLVTGDSLTAGKIETKNGYVGTYVYNADPKVTESTITEAFETKNGIGNYNVTIVSTQEITGKPVEPEKKESSEPQETNYKLGEKIEFTITVKNISKEDLTGFKVVDATAEIVNDVVKGISVDPSDPHTATITATLKPGEQIELTAIHTVDENDILNARAGYKNIAEIKVNDKTVYAEKTIEEIDHPRYDFTVEKKLLADDQHVDDNGNVIKPFELGDTAYFTITIVNTGNMTQTINLREDGSRINGQVPTFVDTGTGIVSEGASSANITLEPGKSVAVTAKIDITEEVLAWRSEPDNKASNIVWAEGAVGEYEGVPTTKRAEAELPLPALHKLTIKYVLENGNPIPIDPASAWKYEIELRAGEKYSRLSPVLNNLETDTPLVEGVMPDHDLEITVIYTGNGGGGGDNPGGGGEEEPKKENERDTTIRIRDYETPLGLSNVFMNAGDCFE